MPTNFLNLIIAGALGGLIRGIVGLMKHRASYKNLSFRPGYIATTIALSALIGGVVTWTIIKSDLSIPALTQINPAIALIIGYAGGDFIENLYKILVGKQSLYPTKN